MVLFLMGMLAFTGIRVRSSRKLPMLRTYFQGLFSGIVIVFVLECLYWVPAVADLAEGFVERANDVNTD